MGEWLDVEPAGSRAYLAMPERGTGPGVLVLHAWWGLNADVIAACDRLAAAGFVALAPSIYRDMATATTIPEAEALRDAPNDGDEVVAAAIERLRGMPAVTSERIGVIGFSLGAFWALWLSQTRPDDVAAVVTVYGTDDGDYATARAAYLGHFAEQDDYEDLEYVRALEERIREAEHDVAFHLYPGTRHWFAEPSRPEYDAAAADQVWERTLAFLHDRLG